MIRFWPEGVRVRVRKLANGQPSFFFWRGHPYNVVEIVKQWQVEDGWWEAEPVKRTYFKAVLNNDQLILLFHDQFADEWRIQRLYD